MSGLRRLIKLKLLMNPKNVFGIPARVLGKYLRSNLPQGIG